MELFYPYDDNSNRSFQANESMIGERLKKPIQIDVPVFSTVVTSLLGGWIILFFVKSIDLLKMEAIPIDIRRLLGEWLLPLLETDYYKIQFTIIIISEIGSSFFKSLQFLKKATIKNV